MSTVWFFGDSFVYGDGCKPWNEYYSKVDTPTPLWTSQVASYLECQEQNLGISGGSNMSTLRIFLENIPSIGDSDYVFIQSTFPSRLEVATRGGDKMNIQVCCLDDVPGIDKYRKESAFNFLHDWIVTNFRDWHLYWDKLFTSALKACCAHTFYIPHYKVVHRFETINDVFPYIKDHHWSFAGHNQMAEYVKEVYLNERD